MRNKTKIDIQLQIICNDLKMLKSVHGAKDEPLNHVLSKSILDVEDLKKLIEIEFEENEI